MSFHDIVNMIPMRNRLVATIRVMLVIDGMCLAIVIGSTMSRIFGCNLNTVFIDMSFMNTMKMPIMKIVGVTVMLNFLMPSVQAMSVSVSGVGGMCRAS